MEDDGVKCLGCTNRNVRCTSTGYPVIPVLYHLRRSCRISFQMRWQEPGGQEQDAGGKGGGPCADCDSEVNFEKANL